MQPRSEAGARIGRLKPWLHRPVALLLALAAPGCAWFDPPEVPRPYAELDQEPLAAGAGLRSAQRQVEHAPEDARAWLGLGREAALRARRTCDPRALRLAYDAFTRALAIERSSAVLVELAELEAFRLRHAEALRWIDAAAALAGETPRLAQLRERALEALGRRSGVLRDEPWHAQPRVAELERLRQGTDARTTLARCVELLHEAEDVSVRVLAARAAAEAGLADQALHHRRIAEAPLRAAEEAREACGLYPLALLLESDALALDEALELARRHVQLARTRQAVMLVERLELARARTPRLERD